MNNDEQAIRKLVADWSEATKAGDPDKVLALVTDDVVFLVHGNVMDRATFEQALRKQAGPNGMEFDGNVDIQEIKILGEWAFMWSKLTVAIKAGRGAEPMRLAGPTLTILQRQNGTWKLARDANLLAPVKE
ncbi:MAG: YybH family protein [Planctomycetota bacterium]